MADRSDEELMSAAGRGDRDAFGILVARHDRAVMRLVCGLLAIADRNTGEDLTQEVFLAAWRAAPRFRSRTGVRVLSWLLRIATNTCFNYRRSGRLRIAVPIGVHNDPHVGAHAEPDAVIVADERARQVRAAIAELPPAQRAAILLREFHGLSYAEIGDVLDTSVSAVESLLVRARRTLSVVLADSENEITPQVSTELRVESL